MRCLTMMFVLVSFIFSWLRREGILYRILDRAGKLLVDFFDVPGGVVIPPACTLDLYYVEILVEGRRFMWSLEVSLEGNTRDAELRAMKKIDYYRMASQRLVYR